MDTRVAYPAERSSAIEPTIVLVHGAFAASASWDRVIDPLLADHPVIAAANPLRRIAADAQSVSDLVCTVEGPVVLVAHSYAGAVITNADANAGEIVGLVDVNGFAPEPGESCVALAGKFPGSMPGEPTLRPVQRSDGTTDLYIRQDRFHHLFCADVTEAVAGADGGHPAAGDAGGARRPLGRAVAVGGGAVLVRDRRGRPRHPGRSPALHGQACRRAPHARDPPAPRTPPPSRSPTRSPKLIREAAALQVAA